MATTYDTVLPEVAPHVAGAGEMLVVNAIRNSVIDFCKRSWAYQVLLGPITITPFIQEYVFAAGTYGQPAATDQAQIMWAKYNNRVIWPVTKADLNLDQYNWASPTPQSVIVASAARCGNNPLNYYSDQESSLIGLTPIPNAVPNVSALYVQMALNPLRASVDMPDWIYETYLEDIAHGALYKLFAMPKKMWTNANLAGTYKKLFEEGCADARIQSARNYTRAPLRTRPMGVARW
jgi:hypothetical protein